MRSATTHSREDSSMRVTCRGMSAMTAVCVVRHSHRRNYCMFTCRHAIMSPWQRKPRSFLVTCVTRHSSDAVLWRLIWKHTLVSLDIPKYFVPLHFLYFVCLALQINNDSSKISNSYPLKKSLRETFLNMVFSLGTSFHCYQCFTQQLIIDTWLYRRRDCTMWTMWQGV